VKNKEKEEMTHYNARPNNCRVDIFKESGKWYDTISVSFKDNEWKARNADGAFNPIHKSFSNALHEAIRDNFKGCYAVCLEPYHENAHPLMIKIT
jgi:hypothetical protein